MSLNLILKISEELKSQPLKRDRENCTVFVADLPNDVIDEDIHKLFSDVSVSPCARGCTH